MKIFTPFQLSDTHGLPLAATMARLERAGMAVSMPHFIREARAAGWGRQKIRALVLEAVAEVGGPQAAVDRTGVLDALLNLEEERE